MVAQFARAPHRGRPLDPGTGLTNAALLIDFDNVTMGIRSDLSKEIKKLLNSDVIKSKVAVQRAYADWRRYPQYIVPLSEASVDLIFAPAYGSSKKNATDIRLAIDALELVFTRPEIGTYILLSGDSDFSSLVLKLKEYGKYVIGVGMRESSSDLLVQNCDEYFSYSALAGLTRAGEEEGVSEDPFVLVERAVDHMVARGDVMRSDRLKQVLLELDPNFDEKAIGFRKFSRFLTEAVNRGVVKMHKLENGQFEIEPGDGAGGPRARRPEPRREQRGRRERGRREDRTPAAQAAAVAPEPTPDRAAGEAEPVQSEAVVPAADDPLAHSYDLLRRAASDLLQQNGEARDSDVKRRMLEMQPEWTESELGFSKFSRFLRQAHDDEIIDLRRADNGSFEVALEHAAGAGAPPEPEAAPGAGRRGRRDGRRRGRPEPEEPAQEVEPAPRAEPIQPAVHEAVPEAAVAAAPAEPAAIEAAAATPAAGLSQPRGLRFRRGTRGRTSVAPPPLLAGQTVSEPEPPIREAAADEAAVQPEADAKPAKPARKRKPRKRKAAAAAAEAAPAGGAAEPGATAAPAPAERLGLPTEAGEVVRYIASTYRGVGKKTAETLVEAFGPGNVFEVLDREPARVREVLGDRRADSLLVEWSQDRERRADSEAAAQPGTGDGGAGSGETPVARRSTRRGGRRGGGGRGGGKAGHGSRSTGSGSTGGA